MAERRVLINPEDPLAEKDRVLFTSSEFGGVFLPTLAKAYGCYKAEDVGAVVGEMLEEAGVALSEQALAWLRGGGGSAATSTTLAVKDGVDTMEVDEEGSDAPSQVEAEKAGADVRNIQVDTAKEVVCGICGRKVAKVHKSLTPQQRRPR